MTGRGGAFRLVGFHNREAPIGADEAADAIQWINRFNAVDLDRIDSASVACCAG
jgi:hypothetical protein